MVAERRTKRGRIVLRKGERVTGRTRDGRERSGVVIDALSHTFTWIRDDGGIVRELLRHTVRHVAFYEVTTTEIATTQYTVEADSAEEAREKVAGGGIDLTNFRDLGHDSMEIIDVKEVS